MLFAGGNDETAATVPVEPTGGLSLGARFADGFQAPSVITAGTPQRAPYVLIGSDGWPAVNVPDQIELTVTSGDQVVFTGTVNRHLLSPVTTRSGVPDCPVDTVSESPIRKGWTSSKSVTRCDPSSRPLSRIPTA